MKIDVSVLILLASTRGTTLKAKSPEEYTEAEIVTFAAKNTWPHICPSCKQGKLSPQVCSTCLHS